MEVEQLDSLSAVAVSLTSKKLQCMSSVMAIGVAGAIALIRRSSSPSPSWCVSTTIAPCLHTHDPP